MAQDPLGGKKKSSKTPNNQNQILVPGKFKPPWGNRNEQAKGKAMREDRHTVREETERRSQGRVSLT